MITVEEAVQDMRRRLYVNSTTSTEREIAEMERQTKKNNDKKFVRAYNNTVGGRLEFDYDNS